MESRDVWIVLRPQNVPPTPQRRGLGSRPGNSSSPHRGVRDCKWVLPVARHHLGWQLAIRHGCYRAFYGRRRATIERLLPRLTQLFRVGVQDFAGVPLSPFALVRGAGQFLAAMPRALYPKGTASPA